MISPPLKWAGGKRSLLYALKPLISDKATLDNKFIDAFAGAGSVSIAMLDTFHTIIYNDTNKEIVNVMNVIKEKPEQLIEKLKEAKNNNSKEYFLEVRSWDRNPDFDKFDDVTKAMRTIFLNKTCYNGLYRVNLKGQFNVPYGKYKCPNIVTESNIRNLSEIFNNRDITFHHHDFNVILDMADPGDVVYFDPPYHKNTPSYFTAYNKKTFDEQDQERLKNDFDRLTERNVYAVISNSATDFIKELYREYISNESFIKVRKSVGAQSKTRKKENEVLINNFRFIER